MSVKNNPWVLKVRGFLNRTLLKNVLFKTTSNQQPITHYVRYNPSLAKERKLELRQYQTDAVQALRFSLAGGVMRQMLCSPTGSGKTEIALEIIRGALRKKKRVVFLCNRVHLVEQTSRRFRQANVAHGVIQGSNTWRTYEHVIVASIQTVAKRGMPDADLILIDEAHGVAGSKDYRRVLEKAKGTPVIGLSATPFSKGLGKHYDSLDGALFQHMTIATTIPALIQDGYLVDVEVYGPSKPDLSKVKVVAGDYNEKQLGEAVDKPKLIADIVEWWQKLANGTATVCFATNIAHSKHIVEQFQAIGVAAEHIDCYTEDDDRKAILERVASGRTTVISNVGILCEGWDFPACKTMILARPTRSMIRYLQMAGRVLRPYEGKEKAVILDHSDTVRQLGFPTDELPMELDDGKPKKSNTQKPKERLPQKCGACHYMKMCGEHACPKCGFAPEKQSTVQVAEGSLEQIKKKKDSKLAVLGKQRVYSELLSMKNARGYSDGWVSHQYREIFGCWPRCLQDVCAEPSEEMKSYVKSRMIRYSKGREKHAA